MEAPKTDIYTTLLAKSTPEQTLSTRNKISTSEKGIYYRAIVKPKRETVVFQVDGGLICDGNKCDKLILSRNPIDSDSWIGHFIELKRKDVTHAITQLKATISHPIFKHVTLKKKYARIVCTHIPSNSGNLSLERYRNEFRAKYQCELKTLKNNQTDQI